MSTIVSRLYADSSAADRAVANLAPLGIPPSQLLVGQPGGGMTGGKLWALGVKPARERELMAGVASGQTAVVVAAPLGTALSVATALDQAGPVGRPDAGELAGRDNRAAPFSDALGIPVLSRTPDPLSRMLGIPSVSHGDGPQGSHLLIKQRGGYKPVIPMPLLSGSGGYKPVIPMPLLSGGRGGYKPVIPLPTLTRSRGGYKPIIPLPTLSRSAPVLPGPTLVRD
ncbi:hypothetical protein [Sandaracinobacteroides saxicola]|uniref:Uncharacterized protein n=1 Tax=Sandaracinobacteroides saxicola TaxID=2759707 RepID=A0A7G5IDS5_9SPHN|nr:hypothetical protein [Sandaracinobacteroides saxicola]QMW21517.1 hypothetical protein H3309_08760 [Sandaracinobacteroides saxicola]